MSFTKEQLKRASKLANETRVIPSGDIIIAMRNCNWVKENYVPNIKKLENPCRQDIISKLKGAKK